MEQETQPPPQQPVNPVPSPVKRLNNKVFAIVVLLIIAVAIDFIFLTKSSPVVKVSNPKDGDKLGNAFVHYINWSYSLKENLNISLCDSAGCKIIASEVPNSGKFNWDMSTVPGIELDVAYHFEVYPPGARERVGKSGTFIVVHTRK